MPSLLDFVIRKEPVSYRGVDVLVRGLALFDITELIRRHLGDMTTVFDAYKKAGEDAQKNALADSMVFAVKLVQDVPDLVIAMIIRATDEAETQELVDHTARLPLDLQVELIRKIIDMTFEEAGGAKKLFDKLKMMAITVMPDTA